MSRFASMTRLNFETKSLSVPLDATGVQYTTPEVMRERLLDLGFTQGLRAFARFHMTHDSTTGDATVRLTDGVTNLVEQAIDLSASPCDFRLDVDLSRVSQSSFLYWELEVDTVGTGTSTGRIMADLTIQTPLFVSVGQC